MTIKIAHVTTVSSSLKGLMLNQLNYLSQDGYEIVGISSSGPDVVHIEARGIRHIPITINRAMSPLADLKTLWQLYFILRKERFTIVHTHHAKASLLGQLAAKFAGVPIILNTIHGYHFHENMPPRKRRFFVELERIGTLCSDLVLSQNEEDIETAITEKLSPPEKLVHIGNGIDVTRFDPDLLSPEEIRQKQIELDLEPTSLVIGFVGRLTVDKGFLDFLRAGQILADRLPDVRFLIVGDADYDKPDAVEATVARDYGIYEKCIFMGFRPNEEVPLLINMMDVLVLPSIYEGFPRSVMEAAAMGVPTVATDVKGSREAVKDGETGLLVPLHDISALAGAIEKILTDKELADRMGATCRQLALDRFDERQVFEKIRDIYRQLLNADGMQE